MTNHSMWSQIKIQYLALPFTSNVGLEEVPTFL